MSLKSKFNNLGIKEKIFLVSTSIIIVAFIILYLALYIFMPRVYEEYKVSTIESKIKSLTSELETKTYNNPYEVLDKFAYDNNLVMLITAKNGKRIYSSAREGFNHFDKPGLPDLPNRKISIMKKEEDFYFKQIEMNCTIIFDIPIKAVDETQTTIKIFFPFAILAIVVISLTISYFYSKIISKPLLEITKKAKKMSNLDFTERFYPKGNDEISQLSKALNIMSENLNLSLNELESANIKLKQDIDKERELEKERKEFIQTISHELKSPITIISGQLEGMIYKIGKYKNRDKYLKESYEVTKEMEQLVLEILNLSKLDNEDFELSKSIFDSSKLIREILRDNYYFIEEKILMLEENIEEDVLIHGDKSLLKKAFTNVIRNAIEHSPQREKIIVKLNKTSFSVENTGVEIEQCDLDNIFKAFYRIDKSRNNKTGGTGLGLYIVGTILDKHNNFEYNIISEDNKIVFNINFNKENPK